MADVPSVGRTVHYVAYGTPGGEFPAGVCRAAIITEVWPAVSTLGRVSGNDVSVCVLNPSGLFFNQRIAYSELKTPGSWHWPERTPSTIPVPPPDPPAADVLPEGYDTNRGVAYDMLRTAMDNASLTPVGVQGQGARIIRALKATYPALDVYLSPSDAPVWPGFGSVDVTIDSGKGGWAFQPDAPGKRGAVEWRPIGSRP